jgi:hypothetical protein
MEVDLNIENYNLQDLLELFKIPTNYDEDDLKYAKKTVLATHPDKSKLDPKYFLFYSKAYKYIYNLFMMRKGSNNKNISYDSEYIAEIDNEKKVILNNKLEKMDKNTFHTWFNDMFDKTKIKSDDIDSGYGEWLKSNDGLVDENKVTNLDQMNKYIKNKKDNMKTLIKYKDFTEINQHSLNNLLNDRPEYYTSDMNSKLQYDDIMRAHNEGVVPVTEEDYINKQKFRNVEELNIHRTRDLINNHRHYNNHEQLLKQNEETDIKTTYKLMKQDEEINNNYNNFWKKMKTIKHNK